MEKFELVDKNGNKTGKVVTYKEYSDNYNLLEGYYLSVVGIVIINDKNEILLQKRSKFKQACPGKWGICGGKVDFGETTIEAAIRETFEEIGIKLNKEKLKVIRTAQNGRGYFTIYAIRENIDICKCILQEQEVEELKYFNIEELQNLDTEGFEWLENFKKVMEMKKI